MAHEEIEPGVELLPSLESLHGHRGAASLIFFGLARPLLPEPARTVKAQHGRDLAHPLLAPVSLGNFPQSVRYRWVRGLRERHASAFILVPPSDFASSRAYYR